MGPAPLLHILHIPMYMKQQAAESHFICLFPSIYSDQSIPLLPLRTTEAQSEGYFRVPSKKIGKSMREVSKEHSAVNRKAVLSSASPNLSEFKDNTILSL